MSSLKASSQDDVDAVKTTSVPSVAEGVVKNEKHAEDEAHTDAGLAFYREALSIPLERREELAAVILKKIDYTLLPFMCLIYLLSFLDKQTLNYSNAYGLQEGLGLKGRDYSWVASVTNIGYLVGAYPSNLALQKFPIGKFISCMLLSWGVLLCAMVGAKNFSGIMVLRFLLGALEACIGPAWMLITSMVWTRDEQPLRMCIWLGCNGIAQLLGAGISWGIGHSNSTVLEPFQLIFLTIGVITLAVGLVALFLFPNSPMDYKLFSAEEKAVAVWRVSGNQTGIKHSKILWHQVKEAFMDPRAYCVAAQQLSIGIINGSITNFMSALLKGFGYTSEQNVMYQLPNGAFQLVSTVAAGWFSSKVKNMTIITICLVHIPSIVGIIGVATINISHRLALTACCWLLGIVGAAIILNWSVIAGNFAGHTKRMTINSANFIFYAAGNVIGPFMFVPEEREEGFLDLTDRENESFRYRL
ncbi:putative MFS allantoate transporter [Periconia macrospinosa]|uniref:Putative MFS allantoate transporter n=1 Tax=Periconia macrospinosa TaxID=97972 RepID=A0A2V1DPD3_9PLEO|nr:putative MFS allantoate transporter [Periconia macrospinosa]